MCQALHAEASRNFLEMETKSPSERVFEAVLGVCVSAGVVFLSPVGVDGWEGSTRLQEGKWRPVTPVPNELLSLRPHDRVH